MMQKMLKALEESDRHLVELEERRLEYEERQLERELQQRREEREFQLRLLQLVVGPVAVPALTHAADDILALLSQLPT